MPYQEILQELDADISFGIAFDIHKQRIERGDCRVEVTVESRIVGQHSEGGIGVVELFG